LPSHCIEGNLYIAMESNIQSLLDKIYLDGIEKAKIDTVNLVNQAESDAKKILDDAQNKANKILEQAKADSKMIHESTIADLNKAVSQSLGSLKLEITNLISDKLISQPIRDLSLDVQFIKEIILTICKEWIQDGASSDKIELLLPEEQLEKFESVLKMEILSDLNGLEIQPLPHLKTGFIIHRKDKGYQLNFSEDALHSFFQSFLRTKTKEWLFGQ
jgi:V/A-type H+-transporting ATPase subunit E